MFARERQDGIARLVDEEGRADVAGLAERFGVTQDCIRKDLRLLAGEGRLRRVYGGAVSREVRGVTDIARRAATNPERKHAISRKAYSLIEDGDTVFLDAATTNVALAELIGSGRTRCTVVSNMFALLTAAADNPAVSAVSTGGRVDPELAGLTGSATLASLSPLRFDKAFMGAIGVDVENDSAYTYDMDDGAVKAAVIASSEATYLVADVDKLSARGTYRFAAVSDFDALICDHAPAATRRALEALGVRSS